MDEEALDDSAEASLSTQRALESVYRELRHLAEARIARAGPAASLVPTELVHEAYMRLERGGQSWDGPNHFYAAAAEAMRRILIDRARARGTLRRGSGPPLTLHDDAEASEEREEELLAIDEALTALEEKDARLALIVKLRYFAGLTVDQTAAALDVTPRTVYRDWSLARTWLQVRLEGMG
jgi:RNA polymerase sigma factor (TIGR02999 family)